MTRINPAKMSSAQLNRLGAEARAVTSENTRPLTIKARRALARAANKGARPRIGAGAKRINITVEQSLLAKRCLCAKTRANPRRRRGQRAHENRGGLKRAEERAVCQNPR